jgi:hypothetical protein
MRDIRNAEVPGTRWLDPFNAASLRGCVYWTDAPHRWNVQGAEQALDVLRREDSQAVSARLRREEELRANLRAEFMPPPTEPQRTDRDCPGLLASIMLAVKRILRRRQSIASSIVSPPRCLDS